MTEKPNPARVRFLWLDQVATDRALPPLSLAVAVILGRWLGGDGRAWPAIPTIAAALGTTDRSVQRALSALEQAGHVAVDRNGGRGRTNRISIALKQAESIGNGDGDVTLPASERVTNSHRKGDTQRTKGCQPRHPNQEKNHGDPLGLPLEPEDRVIARAPVGAALRDLTPPDTDHNEIEAALAAGELTPAQADFLRRNRSCAHA